MSPNREGAHWTDRQLPGGDEVFLDHAGYFSSDLGEAGATFERLGFQVSQVNVQTNDDGTGQLVPSGTSNRLVRLRRGYLEILAPTHHTPLGDQARAALARYAGIHLIALSHDDIPAQRERLTDAGFAMQDVVHLRRHDVTLPGAPEVAWSVLRPQPGVMPEGRIQFTKSHNPENVWRAELTLHANAADGLGDVLLCVADRNEAATRFGRYTRRPPIEQGGLTVIALERARLVFVDRRWRRICCPVFSIRICPLSRARPYAAPISLAPATCWQRMMYVSYSQMTSLSASVRKKHSAHICCFTRRRLSTLGAFLRRELVPDHLS